MVSAAFLATPRHAIAQPRRATQPRTSGPLPHGQQVVVVALANRGFERPDDDRPGLVVRTCDAGRHAVPAELDRQRARGLTQVHGGRSDIPALTPTPADSPSGGNDRGRASAISGLLALEL